MRPYFIWFLSVIVFWAFAYTLSAVLLANLTKITAILWPNDTTSVSEITPVLFLGYHQFFQCARRFLGKCT